MTGIRSIFVGSLFLFSALALAGREAAAQCIGELRDYPEQIVYVPQQKFSNEEVRKNFGIVGLYVRPHTFSMRINRFGDIEIGDLVERRLYRRKVRAVEIRVTMYPNGWKPGMQIGRLDRILTFYDMYLDDPIGVIGRVTLAHCNDPRRQYYFVLLTGDVGWPQHAFEVHLTDTPVE